MQFGVPSQVLDKMQPLSILDICRFMVGEHIAKCIDQLLEGRWGCIFWAIRVVMEAAKGEQGE